MILEIGIFEYVFLNNKNKTQVIIANGPTVKIKSIILNIIAELPVRLYLYNLLQKCHGA